MASEIRYNLTIAVGVDTRDVRRGGGEVEKELSRWEKRVQKLLSDYDKLIKVLQMVQKATRALSQAAAGGGAGGKEARDFLKLQAEIARTAKAIDQSAAAALRTKQAEIGFEREKVKYLADQARLKKLIDSGDVSALATQRAESALQRENVKLLSDQLRLKKQIESADNTPTQKPTKLLGAGGADREMVKAQADIARIQKQRQSWEREYTNSVGRESERQYQFRLKNWQKGAADFQRIINQQKAAEKSGGGFLKDALGSSFLGALAGGSIGAVAGQAISAAVSAASSLINVAKDLGLSALKLGGDFQVTTNALSVFAGSTRLAKQELASIDELARNTPGLRLESAQTGFQQLRALGFQADIAKGFIKELGEEKILSGASDEALGRIIFNFAQIASGGQKVSQELREILTAMPTLQKAFFSAFQTLDPQKIQTFFDKDTDAAFKRLIDSMAAGGVAAGGLNDGFGKLQDEFIRTGRTFAEPILNPLTKILSEVSKDLASNESAFRMWGENVAGILKLVSSVGESRLASLGLSLLDLADRASLVLVSGGLSGGKNTEEIANNLKDAADIAHTIATYSQTGVTIDLKGLREAKELEEKFKKQFSGFNSNQLRGDNTVDFSSVGKSPVLTQAEIDAQRLMQETKNLQRIEKSRQQFLENLKLTKDRELEISSSFYTTEEAMLASHLDFTTQQRLTTANAIATSSASSIRRQILLNKAYYDDLLKFGNLSDEATVKTTQEKNLTLFKLNNQLAQNEFKNQKQIAELSKWTELFCKCSVLKIDRVFFS